MNAPTFTHETMITVGKYDREIDIEATYEIVDGEVRLIDARDMTRGGFIENDWILAGIEDDCREAAPEAYAEWLAERGEYERDAAADRRLAA